jgi:hypothetical protein
MRTTTRLKTEVKKLSSVKKPEGKPKVKLGTGKKLLYMSETLFDDDLKA